MRMGRKKDEDRCEFPGCKKPGSLFYRGHWTCDFHWCEHCESRVDLDKVYKLGGR
jgi:hypothetical protein